MTAVSINRQIGSILVVIGTEVGAGILALPILIAHIGFPLGSLIMLIAWALMTYTALMICEVNLALEDGISFAGMASRLLGSIWQLVVWLSFMVLLYTIMAAYISAAGSAFHATIGISANMISLIFVILLGTFVVIGTHAVDWINRILLAIKLLALIFVCISLIPEINPQHLSLTIFNSTIILSAIPVFITTFTSHIIIPPLRTYLKSDNVALVRVIFIGSLIPLILYLLWIMCILGVIPYTGINSFQSLFNHNSNANVGDILNLIRTNLHSNILYAPVSIFSNISVTTSFLGVSLSLFYFIIDGFKLKKFSPWNRNIIAIILTFMIPLIIVWYFPNVFIKALGVVGLCCSILLIIAPYFMLNSLINNNHQFKIKLVKSKILRNTALILGFIVIIIQLFY